MLQVFLKTGISNALDGSEDDALWLTEENVDEESESDEDYSSEEESNDSKWTTVSFSQIISSIFSSFITF